MAAQSGQRKSPPSHDDDDSRTRQAKSSATLSFTWYRLLAALVVLLAGYVSPQVTSSFLGRSVLDFAECVAHDHEKTMGQCLSNVFHRITGTTPDGNNAGNAPWGNNVGDQPAHRPEETFNEQGRPQNQYDSQGGRVFAEAEKHREEAEYQAKLRGEKLQESRDAYQAGHKANAHELSVEGKHHGQLMEEANKRASQAIIKPQNSERTGVLDLHGLYVKEAEEASKDFLLYHQRARHMREVEIITGAGQHSKDHDAKIRPAIERLISGLDFPYHNPPHNNGAFVVELFPNQ